MPRHTQSISTLLWNVSGDFGPYWHSDVESFSITLASTFENCLTKGIITICHNDINCILKLNVYRKRLSNLFTTCFQSLQLQICCMWERLYVYVTFWQKMESLVRFCKIARHDKPCVFNSVKSRPYYIDEITLRLGYRMCLCPRQAGAVCPFPLYCPQLTCLQQTGEKNVCNETLLPNQVEIFCHIVFNCSLLQRHQKAFVYGKGLKPWQCKIAI